MTNREYALLAAKTLSDKKAQDVVIIDIQEKAAFADYFVICSGTSERQINSLIDDVEDAFARALAEKTLADCIADIRKRME